MILKTLSAWNYGHTININNQKIDFTELASPTVKTALIAIKDYTLGEFINAVALAMNDVASQVYTVTLDRTTRKITISAPGDFELLPVSGPSVSQSAYPLMGFDVDTSGTNSYEAPLASGSQYITQYYLQNYVDFEDDEQANESTINTSASGDVVESVQFGKQNRMNCDIEFISDKRLGMLLRKSSSGVSEAREFLRYITTKARLEFLKDVDSPNDFTKCIHDRNRSSRDGTGYKLNLDYDIDIYNAKRLVFLKVQ